MKRSPSGFGSFYWERGMLRLYYCHNGKRYRPPFAHTITGTPEEKRQLEELARQRLDEIGRSANAGQLIDSTEYPTYQQMALFWWEKCMMQKEYISGDSQCAAGEWYKLTIGMEWFQDKRANQITREDVKKFRMSLSGRACRNGKPWSAAYINRFVSMIGQVYHECISQEYWMRDTAPERERVRYGNIDACVNLTNPVHGLPRKKETPAEPMIPTLERFRVLLDELPVPHRYMALIGAQTGLRRRNVIKLQWSQVDLDRGLLSIGRANKTEAPLVLTMCAEVRWLMQTLRAQAGGALYVFERSPGAPYRDIGSAWDRACKRAQMPGFQFRHLRTMYASWLIERGVALGLVQRALGHTTVATTAQHYNKTRQATAVIAKGQDSILFPDTFWQNSGVTPRTQANEG